MSRYARSAGGAVTAPHHLAAAAGAEVLAAGGNAIEAALAVGSTLTVVYPHMNSLGGDGFWLISDADGRLLGLDGAGPAGQRYTPEVYTERGLDGVPMRGALAANTVAGLVSVWGEAFRFSREAWAGRRAWDELLASAHAYARDGFPCSVGQGAFLGQKWDELGGFDTLVSTFAPDGRLPEAGATFRQAGLAASLALLQRDGADGFYRGELGWRVAEGLAAAGSRLTSDDLAGFRCRLVQPIGVPYRGGRAVNMPPPTQGLASLLILGQLDRFDLTRRGHLSARYVHLVVEATKQAFRLRDRHVADPERVAVPVDQLLAPASLDALAVAIDPERAAPWGRGVGPADTVWFGVVDAQGRAVSAIQSIYHEYGSGIVAGDTGIVWQNRGASFSLDPSHVNALAPGKRPFHTLNPAMYLRDGRPHLVYGTMGGDGQPQTQAAVATRALDYGLPLDQVLDSPRWLLGRTWGQSSDTLKLEGRFSDSVFADLAGRGHAVERVEDYAQMMGHAGALRRLPEGGFEAASDPRSDGAAIAV
ncbi:gamma-glutamyltransferase [Parasulfuritortus cantonensis]|uniref:Glutathione hydrolase proenzyme n=1 Tax=Parasulfuritortus cantonensis TaxID=2528202 RepID=A0A4R1BJ56_9PROT|nr:gamma-glutamyltransferase [Parasulfuritortus cantonensis]TCJ17208.1 gamma-glutamyltransferase [Parasulfuritortus cantonensis]